MRITCSRCRAVRKMNQRRRTVRKKFMVWLPGAKEDPDNEAQDPIDNVAAGGPDVPELLMQDQAMQKLEGSLRALPARQREGQGDTGRGHRQPAK